MIVSLLLLCAPIFLPGCAQNNRLATSASARNRPSNPPDFVTLARKIQPVVVNVSATIVEQQQSQNSAKPQDDFLEHFFGMPPPPAAQRRQHNLGSGFVVGSAGIILTNAHVVHNADRITVKLFDKREFPATVQGKDLKTDIAILKIDAQEKLQTVQLGNSDDVQVGEWVMAVGNPFGLDNTVTSGIVSAKGRHIGAGPYDSFIQTNASLNPGNSGGPLVNAAGQVIGINLAIVNQGGGNSGIAFATPINLVKELLPQLQRTGKVTRGWAGLVVQETTSELAKTLGVQGSRGALVAGLATGGPAERAGVKLGDIIIEYDGKQVNEPADLPAFVARTPIDKKVQVNLLRDNKPTSVAITIAEAKDTDSDGEAEELG
jgi:serine protease Do